VAADDFPTAPRHAARRVIVVGPGESGNQELGAILRELREFAGRSRIEAAADLGFSVEYLRLIETGRRAPALGQMPRFLSEYRALGGVLMPQRDGSLADLIVYLRPDEPIFVEFRSRIREARAGRRQGSDGLSSPSARDAVRLTNEHDAQLGFVVSMLTVVGPDTVGRVCELLEAELP